jgi:hypothetical protein
MCGVLRRVHSQVGVAISKAFDPAAIYRPVVIASTACGNGFSLPLSRAGALIFSLLS